jgi:hypothetical protein
MSTMQQIGQLSSIDAVALVPDFQQGIFSRIAHQHFANVRFEQVVQSRRASSFLEGHTQAAAQSLDKLEQSGRFRFQNALQDQLAGRVQHRSGDGCRVNVQPNILGVIHEGAPSCRR